MPDHAAELPATLTIQQAADLLGVNPHTLRYYERVGLLTSVPRSARTHRLYTEREIGALRFLLLLRATGMTIRQIKVYVELLSQGPDTLQQRETLLADHERQVLAQISALQQGLPTIQRKLDLYRQKRHEQTTPTGV